MPTRPEVAIAAEPGAPAPADADGATGKAAAQRLTVRYHRTPGTASGTAFPLPASTLDGIDSIDLRLSADPEQRLIVALTDSEGVVWSFPPLRVGGASAEATLRLAELRPDRWQNAGKTIPAAPDLASMTLLTLLDISGHMGAPAVDCAWTIDSFELRASSAETHAPADRPTSAAAPSIAPEPAARTDAARASRGSETPTEPRPAAAATSVEAQRSFFHALQHAPDQRAAAMELLAAVVRAQPDAGRPTLLLGAGHLWAASDIETPEAAVEGHLREAIALFESAAKLLPEDDRIASWLHSSKHFLARRQGRTADADAQLAALRAIADASPAFHSVAYGIVAFESPRGSPAFNDAVAFARRAALAEPRRGGNLGNDHGAARAGADAERIGNAPRWPYTVQGFLVGAADLFARSGDPGGAEELLLAAAAQPETGAWPHRSLIDERLDALRDRVRRWADEDPSNDPDFAWAARSPHACVLCHATAGR
ncbi:MAG TPA: hypothetical protein PKC43_08665 [Phycisphaerales bacterium]|nr:hypothetical protein [Phycisphaerales bacterium]HMP37507.1 hypothetical protein [Phycisphaerales bacterium]